ncbi:hypothetical protein [Lentzea jiangxiensis]|uniref:Heparin binding hemagglutinin HbhA n=1 Tax=Lentzea jiangxiensis TaxID=641025 RepID=A0A1H0DNL5_9PSEU|nr:hypothetical protein [Lentzea jiangxiensis]SDN71827.1 heparin binding hemagglutinin HbhA [Lentzea jiangxiensis]
MPKLTQDDVRKGAEQAAHAARQALLAALGAGDLAAKAVVEALGKAKERAEEARTQGVDLPAELKDLREKLQPAELKKLVDVYTASAVNLYTYLADQGEQTLEQIKAQPQLKQAVEAAQKRAGTAAADAKVIADDVLGKVTRRTRSVGEKVAHEVEDAAEKLAEEIVEVGGEAAHEVRTTTRKAAARTAPRKPATTARTTTTTGTTPAAKKATPDTTK